MMLQNQRYINIATNIGVSLVMSFACIKSISFIARKIREKNAAKEINKPTQMEMIVNSMIPPPDTILVERIPRAVSINLENKSNVFNQKIKVFVMTIFLHELFEDVKYLHSAMNKCGRVISIGPLSKKYRDCFASDSAFQILPEDIVLLPTTYNQQLYISNRFYEIHSIKQVCVVKGKVNHSISNPSSNSNIVYNNNSSSTSSVNGQQQSSPQQNGHVPQNIGNSPIFSFNNNTESPRIKYNTNGQISLEESEDEDELDD